MPAMLGKLVAAGPTPERPLLAVSYTPPGQELAQDVHNANVELLLHAAHWDVVMLQERSWRLSQEERAWHLRRHAGAPHARERAARHRPASVADSRRAGNPDTGHPSLEGSYLAASMMYDALFAPSDPATSTYTGGLPVGEARFLRVIAHSTWLAHPTASPYSDWQAR
jgi:hypothetical protein